jgi:hypothetical protein
VVVLPPTADFDRDFDRFFLFFPIILNVSSINNDKTGAARADFQTRERLFCALLCDAFGSRVWLNLSWISFVRCVKEIFLVLLRNKSKKEF